MKTFLIIVGVLSIAVISVLSIGFWCSLKLAKEADEHADNLYCENLNKNKLREEFYYVK